MKILLRPKSKSQTDKLVFGPTKIIIPNRLMRILDFDCECRPMHWIGNDYVSKEITAIAWAWTDRPDQTYCVLLGLNDPIVMLEEFRRAYDQADMVTGHYIRGFDLPLINGAMTEYHLPVLGDKLTQDTKLDFVKRHGLSSSQENIGAMLLLEHDKIQMNQQKWRAANRLTMEGISLTRARVTGDVQQHIEMRRKLVELGYLGPYVEWKSGALDAKNTAYAP